MGLAQTTLPPTSPTVLSTVAPDTSSAANVAAARPAAPSPAKVAYADGKLAVTANNSSLNQILREICRLTGMTITGGVAEQRVFGAYGPAAPGQILGDLLQGTGSNMLLRETAATGPTELILTPREGGVTPPNPNAGGFDGPSDAPNPQPQLDAPPLRRPQYSGSPISGGPAPVNGAVAPATQQAPPPGNTPSPNGVLSPEQIYQQLQQLQRTQSQPQH